MSLRKHFNLDQENPQSVFKISEERVQTLEDKVANHYNPRVVSLVEHYIDKDLKYDRESFNTLYQSKVGPLSRLGFIDQILDFAENETEELFLISGSFEMQKEIVTQTRSKVKALNATDDFFDMLKGMLEEE